MDYYRMCRRRGTRYWRKKGMKTPFRVQIKVYNARNTYGKPCVRGKRENYSSGKAPTTLRGDFSRSGLLLGEGNVPTTLWLLTRRLHVFYLLLARYYIIFYIMQYLTILCCIKMLCAYRRLRGYDMNVWSFIRLMRICGDLYDYSLRDSINLLNDKICFSLE